MFKLTVEVKQIGELLVAVGVEGVGLTAIVKLVLNPEQLFAIGVTVIVAKTCEELVLIAVNCPIFPTPLPSNPIDVWSFDQ